MRIFSLLVLAALLGAAPAWALDLQEARARALVGEQNDGYVRALQSGVEVKALVAEINTKRKIEYARISRENGQSVEIVAKLAAGQIVKNLSAGAKYQDADGNWRTR